MTILYDDFLKLCYLIDGAPLALKQVFRASFFTILTMCAFLDDALSMCFNFHTLLLGQVLRWNQTIFYAVIYYSALRDAI